jgi:hypothetical protein
MYKNQINQLTENSNQIMHELKLLQEDYRQIVLKNDITIQENIHR